MLAFFRRAFNSKVVLLVLGFIALAVVVTGVGTPSGLGLGGSGAGGDGDVVAKVDGTAIHAPEVAQRVQNVLDNARRQQPNADMAALIAQGGVEGTVEQMVGARALEAWAARHGFVASERLVEGEIASVPAFAGPTGKFDEDTYRRTLAQARITEPQLRADVRGDLMRRLLLGPISGGTQAPVGLVMPYASLPLEQRQGLAGFVPAAAIPAGPPPTDAALGAWYTAHLARYTLPERRVLRTALIAPDQAKAAPPGEAEIAAAYRARASDYAAREQRAIAQLTLPTEAAARAAAAKIAGGASFDAVAQAAGFAPSDTAIPALDRAGLAERSGADVAAAAFALAQGKVSAPVRSSIGWAIVRLDAIRRTPARTLDQVRGEIAATLAARKRDTAFADLVAAVQDQLDGGATFDEVAKAKGLPVTQTPPLTAQGAAPGVAGWAPPPALGAILKPAFDAAADDEPSVEQLGPGRGALLVKVAQIIPAAPVPLAQVKDAVARDIAADRARAQARVVADAIVAKANRGMPLGQAIAASGLRLPAPQPIGGRQADIARADAAAPPVLTMLFAMKPGSARIAPSPDGRGWFVVQLNRVVRGDARTQPQLVDVSKREFGRILGEEYAQQFARAVELEMGSSRDPAAIARLKASLAGGQPGR